MYGGARVEQVFVERDGGRWSVRLVLEDPAGARRRETLPTPADGPEAALDVLARHLARRGDVDGFVRLRVRLARGGDLEDRPAWGERLRAAYARERGDP
ncbi:MAG: hypothetical protein RI554_09805 [Trueperaceae bacterium]|nr:hypothetical protein [Trueperaceae bacterium]